jgi:RNA polymerase sigma-70 factor (ECF subfamily)
LGGDRDASFSELVSRYKNLVYSIINRQINNRDTADDLAQDVFLKMYRNLGSYSPEFKVSTWVMRITSNHIIDYHRKRRQECVPLEEAAALAADALDSPEEALLRKERAARVNKLVAELPGMYRLPIIMFHHRGMSYQEISESIGEPLSKVKNRIFRGRKLIKEGFAKEML